MRPAAGGRRRREISLLPNHVILLLLWIFAVGPLVVLAFNSVKKTAELGRNPLGFPRDIVLGNFAKAWEVGNFSTTTRNSGIQHGASARAYLPVRS